MKFGGAADKFDWLQVAPGGTAHAFFKDAPMGAKALCGKKKVDIASYAEAKPCGNCCYSLQFY